MVPKLCEWINTSYDMLRVTEQNIFFDKYLSVGHTAAQVESCLWVQAIRIRWSLFVCADYVSDGVCSCVQTTYQIESVRVCRLCIRWSLVRVCRLRISWRLFVCADYVSDGVCSCVQTTYLMRSVRVCRLRIKLAGKGPKAAGGLRLDFQHSLPIDSVNTARLRLR